jgi:hypothetical protein
MKNLRKLERKELYEWRAPQCSSGYKPCMKIDETSELPKWSCIPSNLPATLRKTKKSG